MVKLAIVTGALLLSAAPALAQTATDVKVDPKQTDVNKIVCQREEQIGSRLGAKKVCLTVKEWEERAQANREETERAQQNTGTRPSGA